MVTIKNWKRSYVLNFAVEKSYTKTTSLMNNG